ncbi:FG-GAP-like repeat-containing protein [Roseateles asaccharophilus]|uniref:Insecticide toxin TcdB middle/N-terminal domain-containing protein n=1 Tax=Roseateles asaccharophilus TaxID=582607 RepID=A0ABU2ADY0_9BURK|nr:FG-GAP-like repeat-containing protein [Roseateles asaccharophilus]MDR7335407.1 hypothetical protein [Roseateles asaccharophilus]
MAYTAGGRGVLGHGWGLQGLSAITRCGATKAIDGVSALVSNGANDKLCLDGQRLIQVDAAGVALVFPQTNDAASMAGGGVREFRLEQDPHTRVRAYGAHGYGGPLYFKVWFRSGLVHEYGSSPGALSDGNTLVTRDEGSGPPVVWPLARASDVDGNYADFSYELRFLATWGSNSWPGIEWSVKRVRYGGNAQSAPTNSVEFIYEDKSDATGDRSEAYQAGRNFVSIRRLASIASYVNSTLKVRTIKLGYVNAPTTGRSLLESVTECVGTANPQANCSPPTKFGYAPGGLAFVDKPSVGLNDQGVSNSLRSTVLKGYVITGDFNGDGRTDILRWGETNTLFLSSGNGNFNNVPAGTSAGQFNLANEVLRLGSPCFRTVAADFNGDGRTDLLRSAVPAGTYYQNSSPVTCAGGTPSLIYVSNGDGSFTSTPLRDAATQATLPLLHASGRIENDGTLYRNYGSYIADDFDGDGILDILSMVADKAEPRGDLNGLGLWCVTGAVNCGVTLWSGNGDGSFRKSVPTLFAPGGITMPSGFPFNSLTGSWVPYAGGAQTVQVRDINQDGMPELVLSPRMALVGTDGNGEYGRGYWTQKSQQILAGVQGGQFALGNYTVSACLTDPIFADVNGDGFADSLCLNSTQRTIGMSSGSSNGTVVSHVLSDVPASHVWAPQTLDIDGDGRSDLLQFPAQGAPRVYRSLGERHFTDLGTIASLQHTGWTGASEYIPGNFSGTGGLEFLVVDDFPSQFPNQLFVKVNPLSADLLVKVISGTGLVTDISYEMLTASNRYASDGGAAHAAVFPAVRDVVFALPVVTRLTTDAGVDATKATVEFGYAGMKAEANGRGFLGFREIRQQVDAPDGVSKLTSVKQLVQKHPHIGSVAVSETYLGALSAMNAPQTGTRVSRVENIYCDTYAAAGAENSATVTAPCPVSGKLSRPYLFKSVQSGVDLAGYATPTTTTTQRYSGGYLSSVVVQTQGSGPAGTESFSKQTDYQYFPDDILNDNWKVARVKKATTTNVVPNSLSAIPTTAGSQPKASATTGQ